MPAEPDWMDLAPWWRDELATDPAYEGEVKPLILDLLGEPEGRRLLDVGCGEGRIMQAVGERGDRPLGLELSLSLARDARAHGPVVVARLPGIPLANASVDGAYSALVLEHLPDHVSYFKETARVVAPGGPLVVVMNHPVWTAPGSSPIREHDGEISWRPGEYFSHGYSDEKAGDGIVRFHHRSMAYLLESAADSGWSLDAMMELGATPQRIRSEPGLIGQEHFPRLLAVRWVRL